MTMPKCTMIQSTVAALAVSLPTLGVIAAPVSVKMIPFKSAGVCERVLAARLRGRGLPRGPRG